MKKAIAFILTIIIALTFTVNNVWAFESTQKAETLTELNDKSQKDKSEELWDNGKIELNETTESSNGTRTVTSTEEEIPYQQSQGTFGKTVLKIAITVLIIVPYILNEILTLIVSDGKEQFTIENLLMGKYDLFDIKFWEESSGKNSDIVNSIRDNVAVWYYSIRNIAAVIMVVVLIYTGVRMAMMIASSQEQSSKKMAQYKKLLVNWLTGIALVFVLHLMMIAIIKVVNIVSDSIINVAKATSGGEGLENDILNNTWSNLWSSESNYSQHQFYYFVIYCMLVYYELKFFVIYFLRAVKIYFYIIISPFVCMTYALDKMGDGRAQAFNNWINEFLSEVLKRPIHLLIYVVFIFSAGELMQRAPLLAIIMFALMSHAEEIVKEILLRNKGSFDKGLKDVKMRDFDVIGRLNKAN